MKFYLFLSLSFIFQLSFAQEQKIQFYLTPHFGGEFSISYFQSKSTKPDYVAKIPMYYAAKFGGYITASVNNKYDISFGYTASDISWAVKMEVPEELGMAAHERGGMIHRLQLQFAKPIKTVSIKRKKHRNINNLFDIKLFSSISYEIIQDNYSPTLPVQMGFGNTSFYIYGDNSLINKNGFGISTGFSLEFKTLGERKLEFGFLYHQGLSKRIKIDWTTQKNNEPFDYFTTYSRGSAVAAYIALPIKLFKIRKK